MSIVSESDVASNYQTLCDCAWQFEDVTYSYFEGRLVSGAYARFHDVVNKVLSAFGCCFDGAEKYTAAFRALEFRATQSGYEGDVPHKVWEILAEKLPEKQKVALQALRGTKSASEETPFGSLSSEAKSKTLVGVGSEEDTPEDSLERLMADVGVAIQDVEKNELEKVTESPYDFRLRLCRLIPKDIRGLRNPYLEKITSLKKMLEVCVGAVVERIVSSTSNEDFDVCCRDLMKLRNLGMVSTSKIGVKLYHQLLSQLVLKKKSDLVQELLELIDDRDLQQDSVVDDLVIPAIESGQVELAKTIILITFVSKVAVAKALIKILSGNELEAESTSRIEAFILGDDLVRDFKLSLIRFSTKANLSQLVAKLIAKAAPLSKHHGAEIFSMLRDKTGFVSSKVELVHRAYNDLDAHFFLVEFLNCDRASAFEFMTELKKSDYKIDMRRFVVNSVSEFTSDEDCKRCLEVAEEVGYELPSLDEESKLGDFLLGNGREKLLDLFPTSGNIKG